MSPHPIDRSLAAALPYGHFLDEGEIALRGNGLMRGWAMHGLSVEAATPHEATAKAEQFGRAMAHLGTGDMLHCVFHRDPVTEYPGREFPTSAARLIDDERREHFAQKRYFRTNAALFAIAQPESAVQSGLKERLFGTAGATNGNFELWRKRVHERWAAFTDASGMKLELLGSTALFRFLIRSVTGRNFPAIVPARGSRLNQIISCERWYGGVAPWVGDLHMRVLCVSGYPAQTTPQMLATVLRHPGQITVAARFICQDPHDTQEQLGLERAFQVRAQLGSIVDIAAKVLNIPRRRTFNQDTEVQIAEIDSAIAAASAGMPFGWCTIVIIVWDANAELAELRRRDIYKDLSALGIVARLEDANAAEAIMSSWPGDGWSNVRRPIITAGNFAELILPVEHWPGTPFIDSSFFPPHTPVPLVCGGTGQEPFDLPTHLGQVANQLMIGPTGSGKSAALGMMVAAATALTDIRIVWLDLDYSSFVLAHALGATYHELAADGAAPLCPLAFLDEPGGLEWTFNWFLRLFARWPVLMLDEVDSRDLTEALELARSENLRTMTLLANLVQRPRLREVLRNYTTSGKWGHIFDGAPAEGDSSSGVTVYEMRGLMALGDRAAAPATELILHAAETGMGNTPTFIYVDEAWRLLSDKVSADWLYDAIRTFRKRNAGIILATQSLTELANSPYRDLLLESCPGKIFLPNAEAKGQYVRETYLKLGLSEHEIELVANAQPRRHYYFHSSRGRRLFTLDPGPVALALCAATGHRDVVEAREFLREHGADNFLAAWLHARGLGPAPVSGIDAPLMQSPITEANGRVLHD